MLFLVISTPKRSKIMRGLKEKAMFFYPGEESDSVRLSSAQKNAGQTWDEEVRVSAEERGVQRRSDEC